MSCAHAPADTRVQCFNREQRNAHRTEPLPYLFRSVVVQVRDPRDHLVTIFNFGLVFFIVSCINSKHSAKEEGECGNEISFLLQFIRSVGRLFIQSDLPAFLFATI